MLPQLSTCKRLYVFTYMKYVNIEPDRAGKEIIVCNLLIGWLNVFRSKNVSSPKTTLARYCAPTVLTHIVADFPRFHHHLCYEYVQ